MNPHPHRFFNQSAAVLCAALLLPGNTLLGAEDPAPATAQAPAASLTPGQLDNLVSPIALYPDSLLSQVLVASTYPLEIVQAYQWLKQHPTLKGEELTSAAQQQNWDPSIQALVVFPDVLKRLNEDVAWTTNLGNAFLASQANVMDSIQRMRQKAEQTGKLASTNQQKVVNATESGQPVVQIQPANPQVIYVPVYDPAWVWGPPLYYPYPVWYYPPPPIPGVFFWFGPAVWLSVGFVGCCGWGGWGWGPRWHDHAIIVNNDFIYRYNFNRGHYMGMHGSGVWSHEPGHRMGVAYPNRALYSQYRTGVRANLGAVQVQRQLSATRVRGAGGPDRIGSREIQASSHNRTAFGGMAGGGADARVHSNRGYSSLGHARAAGGGGWGGHDGGGGWGGGGRR